MTVIADERAALACDSSAIPLPDRQAHFKLLHRLFVESAVERKAVPGGYRFRFGADVVELVGRFVENERKCCPFLTFTIEVSGHSGPIWLEVTGPEGTREFLDAELPQIRG